MHSNQAMKSVHTFSAIIHIIGINPFVFVPEPILQAIFKQAGKSKGAIPICGTVNGEHYKQTLVRYSGDWRLYINTTMLKKSPERIGEEIALTIAFDPEPRVVPMHAMLKKALSANAAANEVFKQLTPSLQQEIVRYISFLKTEKSIENNVTKAIDFLLGKGNFIGRKL